MYVCTYIGTSLTCFRRDLKKNLADEERDKHCV